VTVERCEITRYGALKTLGWSAWNEDAACLMDQTLQGGESGSFRTSIATANAKKAA